MPPAMENIIGKRFGRLVVLNQTRKGSHYYSCCQCDCGNFSNPDTASLRSGVTTSCGCRLREVARTHKFINRVGMKFGHVKVRELLTTRDPHKYKCECLLCGNYMEVLVCHLTKNSKLQSCGCLGAMDQRLRKGKQAPNWRGGITPTQQLIRNSAPYKDFRQAVFTRDNFTCQVCKWHKGRCLNAHHFYSYATNHALRFDINNGITLCKVCHKQFHDCWGYNKNTKIQFEIWCSTLNCI